MRTKPLVSHRRDLAVRKQSPVTVALEPKWIIPIGLLVQVWSFQMLWLLLLENDFQSTLRGIDKLPVLYMMGSGTAIELRTVLLFFLTRKFSPPLSLFLSPSLSPPSQLEPWNSRDGSCVSQLLPFLTQFFYDILSFSRTFHIVFTHQVQVD